MKSSTSIDAIRQRDEQLAHYPNDRRQRKNRSSNVPALTIVASRVGCRDKANIDGLAGIFAHRTDRLGFENAEEPGLQRERQLADLIEKYRPPLSTCDRSGATVSGSRECAARMAKQLGLDEAFGERTNRPR